MARVVGQHVVHHRALDHGVGVAAHAGVEEQVANVAQAARGLVEEVLRDAGAEHAARDRDLGELGRQDAAVVLEGEVDLGEVQRLTGRAPIEDHVLHRVAAQLLGALFAHHPADGVGDVGLAAAVRADDPGDPVAEQQLGLVDERLESLQFDLIEEHPCTSLAPERLCASPRAAQRLGRLSDIVVAQGSDVEPEPALADVSDHRRLGRA